MTTVTGVHAVREALRADPERVRKVVLAEGRLDPRRRELLALARANGVPVYRQPRERLGGAAVQAEVSDFVWADFDEMVAQAPAPAFLVVLDQVEDPRNFGAVIRAADGAGAHGVVVPQRNSAPPSDVALSASAGALHWARVARVRNVTDALDDLKAARIWTVGLCPDARESLWSFDFREPVAVVLGAEGHGIRPRVASTCDALVSLPQLGRVQSLNLSVAAGIVLYEVVRQRRIRLGHRTAAD